MNKGGIPSEARLEIKYTAPETEYHRLFHWVKHHSHGFFVHYPDRIVNNIYFDSQDYSSFWETLSGFSSRTKVRYRWYGESFLPEEGVLEFKNRKNQYTWKDSYKLSIDWLKTSTSWEVFFKSLEGSLSHEARCRFQENPLPILINCYKRNYFINRDHTIRITLDTGLKIFDQRYSSSPNLNRKAILPSSVILELKFSEEKREQISQIFREMPVSMSRNSQVYV
jgi:SPX domain protein involved in polyphosphate accumulation